MLHETDVAVVGGGLGGSATAAMLGRAGISVLMIDPHPTYRPEFRCEKLDGVQTEILRKTGLDGAVLQAGTYDGESWVARFGHVIDKRKGDQYGIMYDTLVNTIREQIPTHVPIIKSKATAIQTSGDRQIITLSDGGQISARLAVVATGLSVSLLDQLGLRRDILSSNHSVSVGFDIEPVGRSAFEFPALTYYCHRPSERMAYVTLFPIGASMRANLFGYRDLHDPVFRQLRREPVDTLRAMMPRLGNIIGDFDVTGFMQVRPIDLYATRGYRQPGIVLVGDAFSTSCPAAGTGARKALNDVERLCNHIIPAWLATPGMSTEKIEMFYDDPIKRKIDDWSLAKAFGLRSLSTGIGLSWSFRRSARAALRASIGAARAGRKALGRARPDGGTTREAGAGAALSHRTSGKEAARNDIGLRSS